MDNSNLIDPYSRQITYLRLSVTDRCDLRCTYCMSEHMQFLSKKNILTFEEMFKVCEGFIDLGVNKIRITGGEPLVRKNIIDFFGKELIWLLKRSMPVLQKVRVNGHKL